MNLILKVVWLALLAVAVRFFSLRLTKHQKLKPKHEIKESKSAKRTLSWDEYKLFAEFYKFFLDFGLKANVFFYGITGAILTIIYNPSVRERLPTIALVVLLVTPFIIGIVLAGAFVIGGVLWSKIAREINNGLLEGDISPRATPYLHYLTVLLILFGGIFFFVSVCLYFIMKSLGIHIW